jgi:hypothetical protein
MDPFGHLAPQLYKSYIDAGMDVRPTIALTRAHLKVLELDEAVKAGRISIDGKIVLKSAGSIASKSTADRDHGVEVAVSKGAVEPVWYLPGVAKRFGVSETLLRRALFEDGGGQYPELLTRPDLKVFLPPIGGLSIYIFGPPGQSLRCYGISLKFAQNSYPTRLKSLLLEYTMSVTAVSAGLCFVGRD